MGYDSCVITEGEMDVLALHEAGIKNCVSVPNGATITHNNLDGEKPEPKMVGRLMIILGMVIAFYFGSNT